MQATIEKLKDLFKKRDEIDQEIAAIIGEDKPKRKTTRKPAKRKTAKRKTTRRPKSEPKLKVRKLKVRKYKCEECSHIFESAADYQDVRCHECQGKRLLTL